MVGGTGVWETQCDWGLRVDGQRLKVDEGVFVGMKDGDGKGRRNNKKREVKGVEIRERKNKDIMMRKEEDWCGIDIIQFANAFQLL